MDTVSMEGFAPRTIDKVKRLLDLMEEDERPALRELMATAERLIESRILPRNESARVP